MIVDVSSHRNQISFIHQLLSFISIGLSPQHNCTNVISFLDSSSSLFLFCHDIRTLLLKSESVQSSATCCNICRTILFPIFIVAVPPLVSPPVGDGDDDDCDHSCENKSSIHVVQRCGKSRTINPANKLDNLLASGKLAVAFAALLLLLLLLFFGEDPNGYCA